MILYSFNEAIHLFFISFPFLLTGVFSDAADVPKLNASETCFNPYHLVLVVFVFLAGDSLERSKDEK